MADIQLTVDIEPKDIEKTANELQSSIESIFKQMDGKTATTQFMSLQNSMAKAYQRSVDLQDKMTELGKQEFDNQDYIDLKNKLQEIIAEYNEVMKKRSELKSNGQINTQEYADLDNQLQNVSSSMNDVQTQINNIEEAGEVRLKGVDTEDYYKLAQQLGQSNNQLSLLLRNAEQFDGIKLPTDKWTAFKSTVGSIASGIVKIAKDGANTLKSVLTPAIKVAAKAAANLAREIGNAVSSKFKGGIKSLASSFLGLKKSSDSASDSFSKGAKLLVKYIFGVRSFFFLYRKIRKAIVEGFGDLAQYSGDLNGKVSQVSTSLLYLRNALTTAFAPIVSYVAPAISQLLDLLTRATTAVGQFFAALFGQTSFVRAKKTYKDYAQDLQKSEAQQQANEAARQKKHEESEAKRYEKYLKQKEKKEKKWQERQIKLRKKYERQLAGFDDVEILKEAEKEEKEEMDPFESNPYTPSTSSSSQKMPWEDFNNMFETVNVEAKFKELVDKLKNMWKNADFTELGTMLGTKLRDALNKIPWDSIKEVLRKIAKSIATLLNGFLETPGLFDTIGRTLAQGLNSAFEFLNSFAKNFHWDSLGKAIKDGILGVLNNIDWQLIYDTAKNWGTGIGTALENALDNEAIWTAIFTTMGNRITAMLQFLDSFITSINWGSLATNIGNGLNNAVENFNWDLLGQTLVDAINAAFDFWYNFVTTFDFYKFGKYIGETLSKVLKEVDWAKGGSSVGETINSLFDALNGFIENTNWEALGKAIVDTIVGFFDSFKWSNVSKFLSNCFTALLTTLTGIIKNIKWEEVPDKIIKSWKDFFSGFDWKTIATVVGNLLGAAMTALVTLNGALWNKMVEFGKNIIEGGYKGIKDKLLSVATWVKDNIFKPFIDAFKYAFQISSPSKVMEGLGKYISQGLFNGAISKVQDIIKKMIDLKDKILGVFNKENWKNAGLNVIEKIYSGISNNSTFRSIKSTCSDIISGIKDKFNDTKWSSVGKNIVSGISDGIEYKWTWLTNKASSLANDVYNAAKQALGIASPSKVFRDKIGKMIPAGMAEGIDNSTNTALTAVSSLSEALVDKAATNVKIPAIVNGEVVPYSFGNTDTNDTNSTLNKLLDMLEYSQNTSITREDLISIFTDLLQRYMPDFYIGDEQIARHANAGNARLDRRFNPAIG